MFDVFQKQQEEIGKMGKDIKPTRTFEQYNIYIYIGKIRQICRLVATLCSLEDRNPY